MARLKKIAAFVFVGVVPAIVLLFEVNRLSAGAWLGLVLLAAIVYSIGRDRGLAAYVLTVACLAFLAFTAVQPSGNGQPLQLSANASALPPSRFERLSQIEVFRASVGLVLLAVIVGSVVFLASDFIFAARGGDRWQAFRYLLYWVLGLSGTYREVNDGQAKEVKPRWPAVKANATELITVHADHAVVLQKGGAYTRVVGPGQVYIQPGESIKKVVRTSGQGVNDKLEDVFTKDEIPVTVHFSVSFQTAPDPTKKIELGRPYPFSEEAVLKAAYNVGDVEKAMKSVGGSLLRDKIAQCSLDNLYDPLHSETFPLGDIRQELKQKLQGVASNWGLVVYSFGISRVEVPPEVRQQMMERWQATWSRNEEVEKERTQRKAASIRAERHKIEAETTISRAEARGRAERIKEEEILRAREELLHRLLQLVERIMGEANLSTTMHLLQTLLATEAEPSRLLPYLSTIPAGTAGFPREELLAEAARGLGMRFGTPPDARQLMQPRHVGQPRAEGPPSEQDPEEQDG